MNPLGEIDDFEVGGKRADQRFGIARRQAAEQRVQLVVGPGDRGAPRALHELEEGVTTLLAQHVADECAERADVIPQLRVFRSKLDVAAPAAQELPPSAEVKSRAAAIPHAGRSTDARPSPLTAIASPFCSTSVV